MKKTSYAEMPVSYADWHFLFGIHESCPVATFDELFSDTDRHTHPFPSRKHDETIRHYLSFLLFAPGSAFVCTAIIDKAKDAFLKLFLNENITWAGTTRDASIERIYASRLDPTRARLLKNFTSNPRAFIDSIARRTARVDEIFSNVRIGSDGDVAQVCCRLRRKQRAEAASERSGTR